MSERNNRELLLGPVFQLDKATAIQLGNGDTTCAHGNLWVPDYVAALQDLKLTTFIQVFGEHQLHENQSQLTLPLYERNARVLPNSMLSFHYELGAYPQCVFAYEKMPGVADAPLPHSLEKNVQGIYHLPRLWHKIQLRKQLGSCAKAGQQLAQVSDDEWSLDCILLDQLGAGIEPALQQMYFAKELVEIEHWLASVNEGEITEAQIQRINDAIVTFIDTKTSEPGDGISMAN